jgi:hypothetical protein
LVVGAESLGSFYSISLFSHYFGGASHAFTASAPHATLAAACPPPASQLAGYSPPYSATSDGTRQCLTFMLSLMPHLIDDSHIDVDLFMVMAYAPWPSMSSAQHTDGFAIYKALP